MVTIGIPKGMFFYEYGSIWEDFFENLGFKVVVSKDTNRTIMDYGLKCCSNETCLPVKAFHGHMLSLKDTVDYVFIPRYHSTRKNEYTCPKICGLPDMAAVNLGGRLRILEAKINMDSQVKETKESIIRMARTLKIEPSKVLSEFNRVWKKHLDTKMDQAENKKSSKSRSGKKDAILLLGHPYVIYDEYLSMRLIKKLNNRYIDVFTPKDIDYETKRHNAFPYQGKTFWDIGFDLLGSAFTCAEDERVKGIVYLTPFACGLDAFIMEFIELQIKARNRNIPLLKLTVDEHTGEAGFDTRIEAFIDMIG